MDLERRGYMVDKTENIVKKLNGYLPFDSDHSNIYEEYQKSEDSIQLSTKALEYLRKIYETDTNLVILTGDAGHGKTHLCRRILETLLGYSENEARALLKSSCDGTAAIKHSSGNSDNRAFRIFKDFSEFDTESASRALSHAYQSKEEFNIVCANEGKLRKVLATDRGSEASKLISSELDAHLETGKTSTDGKIHIINLNFQSVSSTENGYRNSLTAQALKIWLDGRRWSACTNCEKQLRCPIYHNFRMLSESQSPEADKRQQRIVEVLSAAERLGEVITIRDLLMLIAYIITGGLECKDVQRRISRSKGWQHEYSYYNLLYEAPKSAYSDLYKVIPLLERLGQIDPGKVARRSTDEKLLNSLGMFEKGQLDLQFRSPENVSKTIDASNGVDEVIGNPENKNERQKEAELTKNLVRALRRRSFFDQKFDSQNSLELLGFEYGAMFEKILNQTCKQVEIVKIKRRIIQGLHTIQGISGRANQADLFIVDPAFGNSTKHAAIISRTIVASDIDLLPMKEAWSEDSLRSINFIGNSVDWLDRHICLRINSSEENFDLTLDLLSFNAISVAADGFISEDFFAHDLRRIQNFLAKVSSIGNPNDTQIKLISDGRQKTVSIDKSVIQVSEG